MQKRNKTDKRVQLPETFNSVSEAAAFWDSHDSTDYEEMMEKVHFDVDIEKHSYLVPVASDIIDRLRERAIAKGISIETFVNLLLQQEILSGPSSDTPHLI